MIAGLREQVQELIAAMAAGCVLAACMFLEPGCHYLQDRVAHGNLSKLAMFLDEYPDRSVLIEGHTDDVGSDESNFNLSQRRANSVRSYLVEQGIESSRLSTTGLGEGSPVAGNDSSTGRQQNRRVEVIISNATTASR
jgi:outer membrane protein OmpA-like peptidoglycan-associated protein